MRYLSTRGHGRDSHLGFTDIILEGLAPDGGLFLPERYPIVDAATLASWRGVLADEGYAGLAARVLALYVDDIEDATRDLHRECTQPPSHQHHGVVSQRDIRGLHL